MHIPLVHDLGRTPLSMAFLARRLRTAGHAPVAFGQPGWASSYDAIRHHLASRITDADTAGAPWVAVGHSPGGLLLRDAIAGAAGTQLAFSNVLTQRIRTRKWAAL